MLELGCRLVEITDGHLGIGALLAGWAQDDRGLILGFHSRSLFLRCGNILIIIRLWNLIDFVEIWVYNLFLVLYLLFWYYFACGILSNNRFYVHGILWAVQIGDDGCIPHANNPIIYLLPHGQTVLFYHWFGLVFGYEEFVLTIWTLYLE